MKTTLKYFLPALIAVLSIAGCQKEISGGKDAQEEKGFQITVTANNAEATDASKTEIADDGTNPYVKWLDTDKIRLWEYVDDVKKNYFGTKSTSVSTDGKTAQFTLNIYGSASGNNFTYTAVYPEDGVTYQDTFCYFEIPASQTLNGNNFDPDADIMIGLPINRAERISDLDNLEFQFKRPGTIVKLTLKGITVGEKISSITITAPEDNKIAGRSKVDLITGEITEPAYYGGTNSITLNCSDIEATGNDVFFFRCLDGTWKTGGEVSIKVTTDEAEYTKTSTLAKDFVFAKGGLTRFGFKDMTRTENLTTYKKYTESTLVEGDYIIYSSGKAMGNTLSSNRLSNETVVITDDVIKTSNTKIVWHIAQDGDYWTIYNADVKQYAISTGSKSQIALSATVDDRAYFSESYTSTGWQFLNKYNDDRDVNASLRNAGSGFACYATVSDKITLYLNKYPLAKPDITVSGNNFTKTITVTWDAIEHATGYIVSCTDKTDIETSSTTSCTFSDLTAKEYTITVRAVDNTGTYATSKASQNITLYDPTITLSTSSVSVSAASGDRTDITYTLAYADDDDLSWSWDNTVVNNVIADGGEVVYTVTENTGASSREGWIKVTLNGVEQEIKVSQAAAGAKTDQNISFSKASYILEYGKTQTETVSGAKTTVTYSSSNNSVATVDNDGKVTTVGAGECTITANAAADDTYNAAQASYTLTVTIPTWSSASPLKTSTTGISGGNANQTYGIQVYSGNTCTFTKSDYSAPISTVKVHASTTTKGVGTITVKVGETDFLCDGNKTLSLSKKGNTDVEYTFSAPSSAVIGTVVVTVNCTTNSLYFKQVIIN